MFCLFFINIPLAFSVVILPAFLGKNKPNCRKLQFSLFAIFTCFRYNYSLFIFVSFIMIESSICTTFVYKMLRSNQILLVAPRFLFEDVFCVSKKYIYSTEEWVEKNYSQQLCQKSCQTMIRCTCSCLNNAVAATSFYTYRSLITLFFIPSIIQEFMQNQLIYSASFEEFFRSNSH